MKFNNQGTIIIILFLLFSTILFAEPYKDQLPSRSTDVDNTTYINANNILMFITNHGGFGRDLSGLFGYDYGTFYPFTTIDEITSGNTSSPLFAGGIWFAGKVNNEIRVAIADYSSEYVPGPMSGGSFLPDDPSFRVYKLYADSMNDSYADYREWPSAMGAPVDEMGKPELRGQQTLWSVFNDADPTGYSFINTSPFGIEVQQTVYASTATDPDTFLVNYYDLPIYDTSANFEIIYNVIAPSALANDMYEIEVRDIQSVVIDTTFIDWAMNIDTNYYSYIWNFFNKTNGQLVFENLLPSETTPVYNGFTIAVNYKFAPEFPIDSFAVIANNAGPLNPVEAGALWFREFPVPAGPDGDRYITSAQQATGNGLWAIHTGDNGGSEDGGTKTDYASFLTRSMRDDNIDDFGEYDYELRFTGSNSNPGVGGSYAFRAFDDEMVMWVPFELWRTGIQTSGDPSDDVRMTIWLLDPDTNGVFNLSSYGSSTTTTSSGYYEHSASGGTDDPYTDWIYWMMPSDTSSGEAGYMADTTAMKNGTYTSDGEEVMARMVLINWNGGDAPPFTQDMPEVGTVFKISGTDRYYPVPREKIDFHFPVHDPPDTAYFAYENNSIYMEYKIFNKGNDTITDMYASLWFDADVGGAGDDLTGCDTLSSIGYTYNGDNVDALYGANPPAFGFKILAGPLVPSAIPEDSALFGQTFIPGMRNLPMTAFTRYIGGEDPDDEEQVYNFLRGLTKFGSSYEYDGQMLTYIHSGNPVIGVGDLDINPADRRMSGSSGPFTMYPGDSQFVKVKLAVAEGTNYLTAINVLKEMLNREEVNIPTNIDDINHGLPQRFYLQQNYPNPFNPSTTIKFDLPYRSKVKVEIFNVLGQHINTLLDKELTAGSHQINWDGTNTAGYPVSSGIYLYRLSTDEYSHSKKMLLIK